ncbi:aminotransferase class IV [Thalassospira xiamenensis]|jgi:branched-chain amino acid aminotransferase|uniref:Probable branched-chain-amino-acid aminotransferase n=1 Tax=Thalassospira xiamenensis TaxID=220697 RepID=A0A367WVW1_9PROT|nr:aminotransferase class IV [Thalassospira xiamenensis]MCK2165493.1 aminotransferase class IV [Thalassospira xiamenensis]RCK45593.1 4-amino-4-deoxychorismate lyase [Thalassospira xiamenensis]
MKVWLNGNIIDQTDAHIAVTDRGMLLGDGFFETMRSHRGRVAWLDRHYERLESHAELIGLAPDLLPNISEIADAVRLLCTEIDGEGAVMRLTVTRGSGPRGLLPPVECHPTVLMTVAPFPRPAHDNGLVLATSKQVRRNPWSVANRIKSLNYMDNIAARREAAACGAEEALVLSVDGSVAETTIANLFGVRDGAFYTPSADSGILPGLARQFIIDWCNDLDVVVHETSILPNELSSMESVFVCNALQGIRFVRSIDDVAIKSDLIKTDILMQLADDIEKSLCLGIDV